jgi:hypothetical protein
MALELTQEGLRPRSAPTLFARRLLRPLINFGSTIAWAPQDPQRSFVRIGAFDLRYGQHPLQRTGRFELHCRIL